MKAITISEFGGVDQLKITDVPMPVPQPDEVLIRVHSLSINPVDVKTRSGSGISDRLKNNLPVTLGWDISGEAVVCGQEVQNFHPGDDVFGMINFPGHGKAYAEYVTAKASHLAKKPFNLSNDEAAASTLAALTAWQVLVKYARIKKGDRVLIHAAAGGVGHFAVQIAKHLGAYVLGTASSANQEFVRSLGADEFIDYKAQPFEQHLKNIDFVLDAIGNDYASRSLKVIKPGGTLINIAFLPNESVIEARELGIHCYSTMVKSSAEDMEAIARLLENGNLKAHISKVFPFEQMSLAHQELERGRTVGKIILRLQS